MQKDMTGIKFGYFTVSKFIGSINICGGKKRLWECLCVCGNIRNFSTGQINYKSQISCGCYQQKYWTAPRENKQLFKHGHAKVGQKSSLYKMWRNMKNRCLNKNSNDYKYYGLKGVSIYKNWINNFLIFHDWCIDNGWKEGLSIDRIDNNGNYEPSNCRFITKSENSRKVSLDNPGLARGSSNHNAKLNEQQVIEIKKMIANGIQLKEIAKMYNIPANSISNIKTGKSWKHIKI